MLKDKYRAILIFQNPSKIEERLQNKGEIDAAT